MEEDLGESTRPVARSNAHAMRAIVAQGASSDIGSSKQSPGPVFRSYPEGERMR